MRPFSNRYEETLRTIRARTISDTGVPEQLETSALYLAALSPANKSFFSFCFAVWLAFGTGHSFLIVFLAPVSLIVRALIVRGFSLYLLLKGHTIRNEHN